MPAPARGASSAPTETQRGEPTGKLHLHANQKIRRENYLLLHERKTLGQEKFLSISQKTLYFRIFILYVL